MSQNRLQRPLLPPIPDLRLEQAYLRSIGFTSFSDNSSSGQEGSGDLKLVKKNPINWSAALYVTARDVVFSPFLQGSVWFLASSYIIPYLRARLFDSHGSSKHVRFTSPETEGVGIGWLRGWLRGLGAAVSPVSAFSPGDVDYASHIWMEDTWEQWGRTKVMWRRRCKNSNLVKSVSPS